MAAEMEEAEGGGDGGGGEGGGGEGRQEEKVEGRRWRW